MCASYSDRSPEDYTTFGYAIAQVLGEKAQDYNWFVRFVLKLVVLSLEDFSGAAPSLWIWVYAIAETPEAALASRESLIGELHRALVDERFTSFFGARCRTNLPLILRTIRQIGQQNRTLSR